MIKKRSKVWRKSVSSEPDLSKKVPVLTRYLTHLFFATSISFLFVYDSFILTYVNVIWFPQWTQSSCNQLLFI